MVRHRAFHPGSLLIRGGQRGKHRPRPRDDPTVKESPEPVRHQPAEKAYPENSARVRSASTSQERRAAIASSALRMALASLRVWALVSWFSRDSMAVRSWLTVASARATASGLERFHWASSARLTASSTLRRP